MLIPDKILYTLDVKVLKEIKTNWITLNQSCITNIESQQIK